MGRCMVHVGTQRKEGSLELREPPLLARVSQAHKVSARVCRGRKVREVPGIISKERLDSQKDCFHHPPPKNTSGLCVWEERIYWAWGFRRPFSLYLPGQGDQKKQIFEYSGCGLKTTDSFDCTCHFPYKHSMGCMCSPVGKRENCCCNWHELYKTF